MAPRKTMRRGTSQVEPPLLALRNQMDHLFHQWFDHIEEGAPLATLTDNGEFWPCVDVTDSPKAIDVSAELPGLTESDIEVKLSNGYLTLRGEKSEEQEEQQKDHYRMERTYGSFYRQIPLPCAVIADKVTADFKNGILHVKLPKAAEAEQKSRTVPIKRQ